MPDLQNFSVQPTGKLTQVGPNALTTIRQYRISGEIRDSTNGHLIADFSGANAILFPDVMPTLTVTQVEAVLQLIFRYLVTQQTGIQV